MPSVGVIAIRRSVDPGEAPYATRLDAGSFAVAPRLVSVLAPEDADSPLGSLVSVISPAELDAVEDRLCSFLQLPGVLGPIPRQVRALYARDPYPVWGDIYLADPLIGQERKRYVVVSPNAWNSVAPTATIVRTTTATKHDHVAFPPVQRGKAHACCGEATSVPRNALRLASRDRPIPSTLTLGDMVSIARGIATTHQLGDAVRRAGVETL